MTSMTIGRGGEVTLPTEMQERYGLKPETPVRLIETRDGILLIPLTDAPMSAELALELKEWQAIGTDAWAQFPYEDGERTRATFTG